MREPKRYYCAHGSGMFRDDKSGHWVEYSEHKAIVEELTEHLRQAVDNKVCSFYMSGMDTSGKCSNCGKDQLDHSK